MTVTGRQLKYKIQIGNRMRNTSAIVILLCLITGYSHAADGPGNIEKRAARIHAAALTIDSHTDTPLRMNQGGFDMAVRHDPRKEFSKIDTTAFLAEKKYLILVLTK